MKRRDVTALVQRIEAFESRHGVRIEALSAFETKEDFSTDHFLILRGELHAVGGSELDKDLELQVSVFDENGRVVATETDVVHSEKFFGFYTFEINCTVPPKTLARIRIVPNAW